MLLKTSSIGVMSVVFESVFFLGGRGGAAVWWETNKGTEIKSRFETAQIILPLNLIRSTF